MSELVAVRSVKTKVCVRLRHECNVYNSTRSSGQERSNSHIRLRKYSMDQEKMCWFSTRRYLRLRAPLKGREDDR